MIRHSPTVFRSGLIARAVLAALSRFATFLLFAGMATVLHAAPPPGWTAQNIGSPTLPGTVTYTAASGQIAVTGPDHVIDYSADSFQFIYQPMQGDGEIVARVVSFTNPQSYPHAGLMMRASLAANSAHAEIYAQPRNGVSPRFRDTTGAQMDNQSRMDASAPIWIKLARLGPRVTAYMSQDGITWSIVGARPASRRERKSYEESN